MIRVVLALLVASAVGACAFAGRNTPPTGLTVGLNKDTIRHAAGEPAYVSGAGIETYWWYYRSDNEIYVLHFKDDVFIDGALTTVGELRDAAATRPGTGRPITPQRTRPLAI